MSDDPQAGPPRRRSLSEDQFVEGVLGGDRTVLARAITLVESRAPRDQALADRVLSRLMPRTGQARRLGISGPPGVGKSTLIEALGLRLLQAGLKPAVLAVDPTSMVSHGSILGDKTRMPGLAHDRRAFVRPSPASGALGGVAPRTREALLLCEAAGFEPLIVETVGVGQNEAAVRALVDCFVLLLQPGAGDELQGIKRGIVELSDLLVVTKSDGEHLAAADRSVAEYRSALHLVPSPTPGWTPRVLACSALSGTGLDEVWRSIEQFFVEGERMGALHERRRQQALAWLRTRLEEGLLARFYQDPRVAARLPELEAAVLQGRLPATAAARILLDENPGQKGAPKPP